MTMQHLTLGRNNGLRVSEIALGTGNFGTGWGHGADADTARQMFDTYASAGGTFIDTAAVYQNGQAEEFLGTLLAGRRSEFTVATKFALGGQEGTGVLHTGNSRRTMVRAVESSLRRLDTDHIDLLWVHFPDPVTPIEEVVRAFDDLARSGKILYGGLSNFPAWLASRAVTLAEVRASIPIAAVQFEYSLIERSADRETWPMAEALGTGATLWGPLAGGLLSGKYRSPETVGRLTALKTLVHTESDARKARIVDGVLAAAEETGAAPAEVSVAWALTRARRSTTGVVPIIGPRTPEQLTSYLRAVALELPAEVFARLDEISAIEKGPPYDQIAEQLPAVLGGDANAFRRHPVVT